MEGGRYTMHLGCMLGGSSSLNAMIYLRGTKQDFDGWKNNGCDEWGYEDVLPYFKKSEDFVDLSRFNPDIHSQGGPLTISPLETSDPLYKVIAEAEKSINLTMINDFNIKEPYVGYGNFDSTTRDGRRCSTLKAFLLPVSNRTNLYVAKNTMVTRIIFENNTAKGVEFLTPAKEHKSVMCTKEVILSAGPIKSPQILMASGIGPAKHLQDLGVPVIKDLPVGMNLHDHMSFPGLVFTDRKWRPKEQIFNETMELLNKEMSYFNMSITNMGLSKLMTFYKTKPNLEYSDVQIIKFRIPFNLSNSTPNNKNVMTNLFGYSSEIAKLYENLNTLSDLIVMVPIILQPLSRGQVMLKSSNPEDKPKINADYLNQEDDVEALLCGTDFIVKLSQTKGIKDAGLVLENLKLAPCDIHEWGSREYWLCSFEYLAAPFFHCVGSCKMGSEDDNSSVVDPKLKVKGIGGLRVMDSSIMPKIVSVNTNAASVMIGEKGSDIVKKCYNKIG